MPVVSELVTKKPNKKTELDANPLIQEFENNPQTQHFIDIIAIAKNSGMFKFDDLLTGIRSRILEELANIHHQQEKRGRLRLLSPSDTFETYHQLNPERVVIYHFFGISHGISGISVPDGLAFEDKKTYWELAEIHESKLGENLPDILRQLNCYLNPNLLSSNLKVNSSGGDQRLGDIINQITGNFAPKPVYVPEFPKLVYSTPQNSGLDLEGIPTTPIPVTRDDITAEALRLVERSDEKSRNRRFRGYVPWWQFKKLLNFKP
ncbi:MAG: hypothetical protein M1142_01755 [Patescibacteria group bacterium]|nr:hypothetical protein [Patescibacteria group bacterium]